jgi:hypothetical protein
VANEAHEANEAIKVDKAKAYETKVTDKVSVTNEAKDPEAIMVDEANAANNTK